MKVGTIQSGEFCHIYVESTHFATILNGSRIGISVDALRALIKHDYAEMIVEAKRLIDEDGAEPLCLYELSNLIILSVINHMTTSYHQIRKLYFVDRENNKEYNRVVINHLPVEGYEDLYSMVHMHGWEIIMAVSELVNVVPCCREYECAVTRALYEAIEWDYDEMIEREMKEDDIITISEMAYVHYFHPNEDGVEDPVHRAALEEWMKKEFVESIVYDKDEWEEFDEADSSVHSCPILGIYDTKRTVKVIYSKPEAERILSKMAEEQPQTH